MYEIVDDDDGEVWQHRFEVHRPGCSHAPEGFWIPITAETYEEALKLADLVGARVREVDASGAVLWESLAQV